jgi:hypothetical protein
MEKQSQVIKDIFVSFAGKQGLKIYAYRAYKPHIDGSIVQLTKEG